MLEDLAKRLRGKRTVILGIGNPLQGDDAIGPNLVDQLRGRIEATLIYAGDVPENYLTSIQAAKPELVLVVIALELGAEPGCMTIMEADRLRAIENFTRNPGLAFLVMMIQDETSAEVIVVGIQPQATKFAAEMSKPVHQSMHNLVEMLVNVY